MNSNQKKVGIFLLLSLVTIVAFAIETPVTDVENNLQFTVDMSPESLSQGLWPWMAANWELIALVISEAAALLPSKVNGIIHAALVFIKSAFIKS